ncbi:8616_t:CDS:2, partial [Racocetra fulgida]
DLRQPFHVAAEFIESHNDDVTQIQFHPTNDSCFISGSVDGLICDFELKSFNEDDELVNLLCDIGDIRQDDSKGSIIQIDYAVDCQFDISTNRLYLFAGSNRGDISILHVAINELQLCQTLNGGHSEI